MGLHALLVKARMIRIVFFSFRDTFPKDHMKTLLKFSLAGLILFSLFFTQRTFAAETLWTLGLEDGRFAEFACAGNYAEVPKAFPDNFEVKLNDFNTKKQWPFIHPGPSDRWAEGKEHAYTIHFDLPRSLFFSAEAVPNAFELTLQGWGHPQAPPTFEVLVNGKRFILSTTPNAAGNDAVLTDPEGVAPGKYKLLLPPYALKTGENTLVMTNFAGSWFIYDALSLRSRIGRIEAIDIEGKRGIFKIGQGAEAKTARKVKVDYRGEILDKPTWLSVEYTPEGARGRKVRVMLNPEEHFSHAEVLLPIDELISERQVAVHAVLELPGRPITSELIMLPKERK